MFNYPTHYRNARKQNSWSPLADLRREMDRLFYDEWLAGPQHQESTETFWSPACDVEEAEDHYLLTLEMPGVPKDQIKIETVENQINISGERRNEERKEEKGALYTERRFGKFQRSFTLPAGVDAEKVEANYRDGILKVYIPKAASSKPRQIKISTDSGNTGFLGKLLDSSKPEKVA